MDKKLTSDIAFVRINILENWRWWTNFAKNHTAEQIAQEVLEQANAMLSIDLTSNPRAKMLLEEAFEFQNKKKMAGQKGGLKKAENQLNKMNPALRKKTTLDPPTKDELYDFATEKEIDHDIARQFWEINESRNWHHKNGHELTNWQGALMNFNKTMLTKE